MTLGLSILTLTLGLAIGFLLAYLMSPNKKRIRALEQELEQSKAEATAYRNKVNEHFKETSILFQDMTDRYRSVYRHLAEGAQLLCDDKTNNLLDDPLDNPQPQAHETVSDTEMPPLPDAATETDIGLSSTGPDKTYLGDSPYVPGINDTLDNNRTP